MKRNIVLMVAVGFLATVTLAVNSMRAQPNNPPSGVPPANQMPRGIRGQHNSYSTVILMLRGAKMDLQHSKNDYNGHRQTAIDACEKALQELEAVQVAILVAASKPATSPPTQPVAAPAPAPAPPPKQ